jgi:hypothetical protein
MDRWINWDKGDFIGARRRWPNATATVPHRRS